jgi:outer membrane protein insertion porin family
MRDNPRIDSIVINGNEQISDGDIKDRMYSRKSNIWFNIKKDRRSRLQRESMERDTLEIKYLYITNGFLGIQIHEDFNIFGEDSSAMIWVNIHEGIKYHFGNTKLSGDYQKSLEGRLNKLRTIIKTEKPANLFVIRQVVFEMKTYMANQGYPYAIVTFDIDTVTARPQADITFNIKADSLVKFGQVDIEGIENYPDYVAQRELKIKPGATYSRQTIIESQRRLFESGYFTFIQLDQNKEGGDRLNPDFSLKIRERKPRFVSFMTGAGQSEVKDLLWDVSFGGGQRNFMGSRRISMNADYSFSLGSDIRLIVQRYRFRYTEPWFAGLRFPINLTFEYEPPIQSQLQNFTIRKYGVAISSRKWYGEQLLVNTGLEYNNVEITDFELGDEDSLRQIEGISERRKLYFAIRSDTRDNIFLPSRGALIDFSADYFGGFLGGDNDFYRVEAAWSTYQVVWPGWTYAIRLKGGIAHEFGDTDLVPKEELLYLGGANTIRGFAENTLGPIRDDGSAEGANISFIFNQEFRWKTIQFLNIPLLKSLFRSLPQWQSIFMDIGNGFRNRREIKFENMAISYGTGFQIVSPAGPIRIDYARRIRTKRYEVDSRWHFTILYAF